MKVKEELDILFVITSYADLGDLGATTALLAVCAEREVAEELRLKYIEMGYPGVNISSIPYIVREGD